MSGKSVLDRVVTEWLKRIVLLCVLPPIPVVIAILLVFRITSYAVLSPILLLLIAFPIIKFIAYYKLFVLPMKRLSKTVKYLKSRGIRIDEYRYKTYPIGYKNIVIVSDPSEIPADREYVIALISSGRGYAVAGIVDENDTIYNLSKITIN